MNAQPILEGKMYSLFNASGKMEEIKPIDTLPLYCKLYAYGYGMAGTEAAIISGPDANGSYKAVYISDYRAGFTTLDKYSTPHSKKFGIGLYFDDNLNTHPEELVKEYIIKAEAATLKAKQDEQTKAAKDAAEQAALPAMFPHLTANPKDKAGVKANLMADLKKTFPGVRFSVAKRSYSAYDVRWTDGPTDKEVSAISDKYVDHHMDHSGDYHDYSPSNFNRVFGGLEYIFTYRDMSAEVLALVPQMSEMLGDWKQGEHSSYPQEILHRVYEMQSLPIGAIVTGIEYSNSTCGSVPEFYRLTFAAPEAKETPAPVKVAPGSIQIVDYSDKAIAVIGDTKPLKEQLSALGGRFNFRLTCGAGWIFSKKKEAEVRQALNL